MGGIVATRQESATIVLVTVVKRHDSSLDLRWSFLATAQSWLMDRDSNNNNTDNDIVVVVDRRFIALFALVSILVRGEFCWRVERCCFVQTDNIITDPPASRLNKQANVYTDNLQPLVLHRAPWLWYKVSFDCFWMAALSTFSNRL